MKVFATFNASNLILLTKNPNIMKTNKKKFSEVLKEKRFEKNLSQEKMAKLLSMSSRMYHAYEAGEYDTSETSRKEKYLKRLANLESIIKEKDIENENYYGNIYERLARLEYEVKQIHESNLLIKESLEKIFKST